MSQPQTAAASTADPDSYSTSTSTFHEYRASRELLSATKGGSEKDHGGDTDSIPKEATRLPASPTKQVL